MNKINQELVELFCTKSTAVGSKIFEAATEDNAIEYALELCASKAPCEILDTASHTNTLHSKPEKIIAAPRLSYNFFAKLQTACTHKGYNLLSSDLRQHLTGIDIGITKAELGIAASGTCMLNSNCEDVRLASMICEISIIVLKKSQIYPNLTSITPILRAAQNKNTAAYTSFISGPSRTADIERVPAIGVHGPLEQHIILMEG